MIVQLTPEARLDLGDAHEWYSACGMGLAQDFLRAMDAVMATIGRYPGMYPLIHGDIRRAPLRRFPYGLYYAEDSEVIWVFAVFHSRRDPMIWRNRFVS